jgi:hypothetical protein
MRSDRTCSVGSLIFAATLVVACLLVAPAGARAERLMDALSPKARHNLELMVRYAVAYDHCRGDYELDDREADSFVAMLTEAVQELPQYAALDSDERKVLLLNLLLEMQQEAAAAPAPDCAVARIGGKRVRLDRAEPRS